MVEFSDIRPRGLCTLPWSGLTINPVGNMVVCCSSRIPIIRHISEVEDLQTFFRESVEYQGIRQSFLNQQYPKECYTCKAKQSRGLPPMMEGWPRSIVPRNDPPRNLNSAEMPILYLDLSVSNVCNQTCIMCGPLYSSKWGELESRIQQRLQTQPDEALQQVLAQTEGQQELSYNLLQLQRRTARADAPRLLSITDQDFQKILNILPTLEVIQLKGGEPLIERRNLEIINRAGALPRPPHIQITTNLSRMSESAWSAIERYPRGKIGLTVSIDGVGRQFEWIRGGDYEQTVSHCNRLGRTGHRLQVRISPTLHSSMNLAEQLQAVADRTVIRNIQIGLVTTPGYATPGLLTETLLNRAQQRARDTVRALGSQGVIVKDHGWFQMRPITPETDPRHELWMHQARVWTRCFNEMRGFEIETLVPELQELFATE
jgi:MoaA/NifB/PqqE/SkfB family radical SAM enzyme